jgi:hypothetical protein
MTPQTITTRDVSQGASWKDWCYQVKKEGYVASEVACLTQQSVDRHINFELKSVVEKEAVLSSKLLLNQKNKSVTEHKEGYRDAKFAILPQHSGDRHLKSESKSVTGGEAAFSSSAALIKRNISPTDYKVSSTTVTLTWKDTSSNELGFEIERKKGAMDKYQKRATVGQNATTYTDTDLRQGTTYHYRVRSYNSHGHSDPSNEIRVIISAH